MAARATTTARIAGAIALTGAAIGVALGAGAPAQAQVHYPWQDAGAARPFTEAAVGQTGRSYCWGGGNSAGPTYGLSNSACTTSTGAGFDCSGLVHFAMSQALGRDIGDNTADGYARSLGTPVGTPAPGDILFFDRDDNGVFEHTGIFLGVNNDNGVVEWVEAYGFGPGATSANGHSVKISAYAGSGVDQINRAF